MHILYKISTCGRCAVTLKKQKIHAGWVRPVFYTSVELSFRMQSAVQRPISTIVLGSWELVIDFAAWELISSAAIAVKGEKQTSPAVICFITLVCAKGRMERVLTNFKVELFYYFGYEVFYMLLAFSFIHTWDNGLPLRYLFIWVMPVHLILCIS